MNSKTMFPSNVDDDGWEHYDGPPTSEVVGLISRSATFLSSKPKTPVNVERKDKYPDEDID